jgi:mRNA interferase MazF
MNPQRGEIWRVQLDPVRGSEQAKTRPVVVMSGAGIGRPSMRVCVPIMHWQPVHGSMLWCVPLAPSAANNLTKDSSADASQIRALDLVRFIERLGALDTYETGTVAAAVALCVGYAPDASL